MAANNKMVGRLASEYQVAPDVRSVSIVLRPDVKFHDGRPLTAKDVLTFDRLKRLGSGVAAQVDAYESTTVQDDTHLTINLSPASSIFLGALSKIYILNSALVAEHANTDEGRAWLQAHDAGSGPYAVAGEQSQGVVSTQLAPDYWDKVEAGRTASCSVASTRAPRGGTNCWPGHVDLALFLADHDIPVLAADPAQGGLSPEHPVDDDRLQQPQRADGRPRSCARPRSAPPSTIRAR